MRRTHIYDCWTYFKLANSTGLKEDKLYTNEVRENRSDTIFYYAQRGSLHVNKFVWIQNYRFLELSSYSHKLHRANRAPSSSIRSFKFYVQESLLGLTTRFSSNCGVSLIWLKCARTAFPSRRLQFLFSFSLLLFDFYKQVLWLITSAMIALRKAFIDGGS